MTSTDRMTDAQRMAQTLGVVIGAASCCEEVTEERVTAVAVKLKQLVSATAEAEILPARIVSSTPSANR